MMNTRYFPRNDGDRLVWLGNFNNQLATYGAAVGLDPAGIKTLQGLCSSVTEAVQADEKAYAAYRAAVAHSATVKDGAFKTLADAIAHMDTAPGCTDQIRAALGIVPTQAQTIALGELKVSFSLQALPGRVVIKWKKGPLDGVNVYSQRGPDTQWVLLGLDLRSPYEDTRPLLQAGTSELRRYRLVGVVHDQEVTPPSDVASIAVSQ
jgi:hypothetical protein